MSARLYLIRHGEVDWNRENSYVGSTDIGLNSAGESQAGRLADYLKDRGITAIYSSGLSRARRTAEIIGSALGLGVEARPELNEVDYGEWEGVPETEVRDRYANIYKAWAADPVNVRIPGGETFGELRDRAFPTLLSIADDHQGGNVAIVAHKSTNRVILACLLGVDTGLYRRLGQGNACLNVIERRRDGGFVVDSINSRGHLEAEF